MGKRQPCKTGGKKRPKVARRAKEKRSTVAAEPCATDTRPAVYDTARMRSIRA
jgi:hypothetical protein